VESVTDVRRGSNGPLARTIGGGLRTLCHRRSAIPSGETPVQRRLKREGNVDVDEDVDVPPLLAIALLRGSGVPHVDRGERGERVVLRLGAHFVLRRLDDVSRDSVEDGLPVGWRAVLLGAGALVMSAIHEPAGHLGVYRVLWPTDLAMVRAE
jgi:hypothetical protein